MTLIEKLEHFVEIGQRSLRIRAYRSITLPERITDVKYSGFDLEANSNKPDSNLQYLLEDLYNTLSDEINELAKLRHNCGNLIKDCGWTLEPTEEEPIVYHVVGPCYESEEEE